MLSTVLAWVDKLERIQGELNKPMEGLEGQSKRSQWALGRKPNLRSSSLKGSVQDPSEDHR